MNNFEKQAMAFAAQNQLVDAAASYLDAAEEYFAGDDWISLTRAHVQFSLLAEMIGQQELAEKSYYQAIVFAEKAAAQDDAHVLLPLNVQRDLSRYLARQNRISDALFVIRQALEHSTAKYDEIRNRKGANFSDIMDTLFDLIIFGLEAEELEDDFGARERNPAAVVFD